MIATKTLVHAIDAAAERAYTERREPGVVAAVELGGVRTYVAVPLLKDGGLIGVLTVYRQEVRPFTDKQMDLLSNFAAQAVIAIENARLLNELRQRTTDLSEALEQQTATSDVLRVISSSGGELGPVFHARLENATRLCEAKFGVLWRVDGETFHTAATQGLPPALAKYLERGPQRPGPETGLGRMLKTRACIQVLDLLEDRALAEREPIRAAAVELGGARTVLVVPMAKEETIVGAMSIYRQEVRPFTDKQISLAQNFAAQAVIAIENARLLNELRRRTDDLWSRWSSRQPPPMC